MKPKYFKIDSNTTSQSLHDDYKSLVLKYHVDRLQGNEDKKYHDNERVMSEINVEYAQLRKKFKKTGDSMYENFRNAQKEFIEILSNIPEEAKNESRQKMQKYFIQKWEKSIKPFVPISLRAITDLIVKEKIKNFDFESQFAKFNLEEFINQFEPIKKALKHDRNDK